MQENYIHICTILVSLKLSQIICVHGCNQGGGAKGADAPPKTFKRETKQTCVCVKKPLSCGHVPKRDGGGGVNHLFFLRRERDAECSETEKYIFC